MGEPVACPRKRGYLVTLNKEKPVVPRLQLATFLWVSRLSEKTLTKLFSIHCGLLSMGEPVACPRKRGYLVTLNTEKPVVPRLQLATFLWVSRLGEKNPHNIISIFGKMSILEHHFSFFGLDHMECHA